jgi:hypothetical protein
MRAARLSPAATLLRNSRLFAVPAEIALPPIEPSSEPVSFSRTATTIYPTRAAIETPLASLNQGDWGLKRPLPIKTTTKSGTPVVRYQRGIDTAEHVVDFESAADHVLTLRKYAELRQPLGYPQKQLTNSLPPPSAFDSRLDHTAPEPPSASWLGERPINSEDDVPEHLKNAMPDIRQAWLESPQQPMPKEKDEVLPIPEPHRRWRYTGPYLAGLNGLEFDEFLSTITTAKREAFREVVKKDLRASIVQARRQRALEEGQYGIEGEQQVSFEGEQPMERELQASADERQTIEGEHQSLEEGFTFQMPVEPEVPKVTDEEVTEHMRYLRSEPGKFGPLIAEFFDLADGVKQNNSNISNPFSYGRDTAASVLYTEFGPPRTHPSAGLSYLKTDTTATNDVEKGPRSSKPELVARLVKSTNIPNQGYRPTVGVAGFIVSGLSHSQISTTSDQFKFEAQDGGKKLIVEPTGATVSSNGSLGLQTRLLRDWKIENDEPINPGERLTPLPEPAQLKTEDTNIPFTGGMGMRHPARPKPNVKPSEPIEDEMRMLERFSQREAGLL